MNSSAAMTALRMVSPLWSRYRKATLASLPSSVMKGRNAPGAPFVRS